MNLPSSGIVGTAASVINFNGGTLSFTGYYNQLNGVGTLNVRGGGAVISGGTINHPLVHSTILGDPAIDGGLTVLGGVTLTTASTYNGPTTVSGALVATNPSGSATGTGAVTVANGAGLSGTGSIGGPVTINAGGVLAPGDAGQSGKLTLGPGVMLDPGAIFELNLGTTTTASNLPTLQVNGAISLDGAKFQFNNYGYKPQLGSTFTIINDLGTIGQFGSGSTVVDSSNVTYAITYGATDVSLTVVSLVPEPGTWTLLAVGALALMTWRWLRGRTASAVG